MSDFEQRIKEIAKTAIESINELAGLVGTPTTNNAVNELHRRFPTARGAYSSSPSSTSTSSAPHHPHNSNNNNVPPISLSSQTRHAYSSPYSW